MAQDITLFTYPLSRGRMAHWTLEEIGALYRLEIISPHDSSARAALLAVNPMGKVPALRHGEVIVTESAAICAYLADAFPTANLAPAPGDPARGAYLRWLFFGAGGFEMAVLDRLAPRTNSPPPDAIGHGSFDRYMAVLENALRPGPYILGDRFSVADIYLASQISYSLMMGQIDPHPTFVDYARRCEARPAHARMAAQADALMAELAAPAPRA